jgi:predicted ester cyclase
MTSFDRRTALAAGAGLLATNLPAFASDRATVEAFYTDFLTASGPRDKAAVAARIFAADWKSYGDYSGKANTRAGLTEMFGGLHQLIPDLTWKIEEILQTGDRYVVRGRASGAPKAPFFGVDGKGRSFTIMSIDIHTMKDGRIAESFHVEDWAGAMKQLSGV